MIGRFLPFNTHLHTHKVGVDSGAVVTLVQRWRIRGSMAWMARVAFGDGLLTCSLSPFPSLMIAVAVHSLHHHHHVRYRLDRIVKNLTSFEAFRRAVKFICEFVR